MAKNSNLHVVDNYFNMDADDSNFVSIDERHEDMNKITDICRMLEELNKKYIKFVKYEEYGHANNGLDDYQDKIFRKAMREIRSKILNIQKMPERLYKTYHDIIEVDF